MIVLKDIYRLVSVWRVLVRKVEYVAQNGVIIEKAECYEVCEDREEETHVARKGNVDEIEVHYHLQSVE